MRTRMALSIVVAVAVLLSVVGVVVLRDSEAPVPKPTAENAPVALAPFYRQKLSWTDCGAARCTWVSVPVDYEKPAGETLRLRVKLQAAEGDNPVGLLFLNPGGPGGSGVDFLQSFVGQASQAMRKAYGFVGFDPRGVGQSTPLKCFSAKQLDALANADPDPDTPAEIVETRELTTQLGNACRANSGALASHVSTFEAAKDIDVLRAVLGQKKLDYYGASYGTQLGATYAQLFPDKVGRMVLDGAVDVTLDDAQQGLGQAEGFQRALVAYVADCVKKNSCPLGTDPAAAQTRLADFMQSLDRRPMKAQDGRLLTEGAAFYGIAVTLYNRSTWSILTNALQATNAGDPALMLALFDAYFGRDEHGRYRDNSNEVIVAVRCLDSTGSSTLKQVEDSIPMFEKVSPAFGRAMAWSAIGCADWPIKPIHPQLPVSAKGAAPIVVVGTTRDPATPYEWAKAMASQLDSGVLLTREGDGHTGFHAGNPCIDKAVEGYLIEDVVPAADTVCKAP